MPSSRSSAGKTPRAARPTMHDVAAAAGVSQMTVSRALRGDGYISDDVKARVAEAVARTGYIQNRMASVQRGVENPMIGVVLPTLKNAVFVEVLAGINDTLSKLSMRPVFGVSEYSEALEEDLVRDMLGWQPCGLILAGMEHTESLKAAIAQAGPRVAEIMDVDGSAISAAFGISQQKAGAAMADHLLEKGYRRIAYLGSQGGTDLRAAKRLAAFRARLSAAGGEIVLERVSEQASSMVLGRAMTEACLASGTPCDAIYYSNDDLAAGGLMHCLSAGIDVPGEIALAGFNDLPFLGALPLRITTTRTPRYQIGALAAEHVAKGGGVTQELAAELIIGETT